VGWSIRPYVSLGKSEELRGGLGPVPPVKVLPSRTGRAGFIPLGAPTSKLPAERPHQIPSRLSTSLDPTGLHPSRQGRSPRGESRLARPNRSIAPCSRTTVPTALDPFRITGVVTYRSKRPRPTFRRAASARGAEPEAV
jgi:hypothetical protein